MLRAPLARIVLLAAWALLGADPARSSCYEPVERDGVVYFHDYIWLHRYDLNAQVWLADVFLGNDAYGFAVDGDRVWVERSASIAARALPGGALGLVIPIADSIFAFAVDAGHVFVLVRNEAEQRHWLQSYDATTGELESAIRLDTYYYGPLIPVSGGRLLIPDYDRLDFARYDADGRLDPPAPLYPHGLFPAGAMRRIGDRLVGDGVVLDADTLDIVEGFEGSMPAFAGDRLATFVLGEMRLYGADRALAGVRSYPVFGSPYEEVFGTADALFGLECDSAQRQVERIPFASFAPPSLPAPIPAAGFGEGFTAAASSEEDILYFVAADGGNHLRRWRPREDRFLASIPLREQPRFVTRAAGGGVWLTYDSGRTSRIEREGEVERAFAHFPRVLSSQMREPIEAGPWIVLTDGGRFHAYSRDGVWRSASFEGLGSSDAAWDPVGVRLVFHASSLLRTLEIGPDGTLTAGPTADVLSSPYPLAVSSASRLYAGDRIVDLETLEVVASLQLGPGEGAFAVWHAEDRLVTFRAPYYQDARYREWSADGAALGPVVTLPGRAGGLFPFGDQLLLARYLPIDEYGYETELVFDLVTPGGDLDSDGVGDADDPFPIDASETSDADGDGVGDNADAFPADPTESADGDGDRLGDNADHLPDFPAARVAIVAGEDWLGIAGLGRSRRPVEGQVHLLEDGAFAFCNARESCLFGAWSEARRGKGYTMTMFPDVLAGFGAAIQADLTDSFERRVKFRFAARQARGAAKPDAQGAVQFSLRLPHRMTVAGFGAFVGAYRVRASGTWLALEPRAGRAAQRAIRPADAPYRRQVGG